ncbi:MAG: NADH-quinone oxidoreductase subunit L [Actinobacteria bacterium]|nr:NADH-quinone oxidoreductase subunit L [Actinomycetota bacterium]
MLNLIWLVPALPLLGFLVLLFFGSKIGDPLAGWLATFMVGAAFVVSLGLLTGLVNQPGNTFQQVLYTWVPAGDFNVDVGFYLDPLSMTLLLVICGIGGLIHLYAVGYMQGDPRYHQFFVYFNLFVFSMLMLVLGDNLLLTFLGWEGVGACSYFLISFWFERKSNASAAKKAFVTNRVGDWGYLVGMFMSFFVFGSLSYADILPKAPGVTQATATFIVLFMLVAVVGKSAQIPLYLWLPDAMAGPTPISALIHAATMVTAGVYLLVRLNPLIAASYGWVPWVIAVIGAITLFVAAVLGCVQRDIKKALAYSTVSQLGYMVMAVGVGGYSAAVFQLVTHAAFKATLFLGAGGVVHGMGDEQDMRRFGGLKKPMPVIYWCMMMASLAISGIVPFSGFWSKDDILAFTWNAGFNGPNSSPLGIVLYLVGLFTAVLTGIYIFRIVYLTFHGRARYDDPVPEDILQDNAISEAEYADGDLEGDHIEIHDGHAHEPIHPHQPGWLMLGPVAVLAFLSVVMGFINLPFGKADFLQSFLEKVSNLELAPAGNLAAIPVNNLQTIVMLAIGTSFGAAGIFVAYRLFKAEKLQELPIVGKLPLDPYNQLVTWFMGHPGRVIFDMVEWFDRTIIDGAVNGVGKVVAVAGEGIRRVQTGYVRTYALGVALGAVLILAFVVTRVLSLS